MKRSYLDCRTNIYKGKQPEKKYFFKLKSHGKSYSLKKTDRVNVLRP